MPADTNTFLTDVTRVRALIPDLELVPNSLRPGSPVEYKFSDEAIAVYIELAKGNLFRAAAFAVSAQAMTEAEIGKVITTEDLSTNGATVMNAMQPRAVWLFSLADKFDADADDAGFNIVPMYDDPPHWEWR